MRPTAKASYPYFFRYIEEALDTTTVEKAKECMAVCVFVNDKVNSEILHDLNLLGVKLVLLRCTGFNNVSLETAAAKHIAVARVPEYSPYAVAEQGVALLMALNRRVRPPAR